MSDIEIRDELAALLRQHAMPSRDDGYPADEYECCADAVLGAGWRPPARVIETAEELDELQPEADISAVPALIRCADNFVFERATDLLTAAGRSAWNQPGSSVQRYSDELAYPVTVLVEPEMSDA